MARALPTSILAVFRLAALGLAAALAGCAPGPMIDRLPGDMGLPAGTPERPAAPYQYPAVHDMPPLRSTPTMSEDDQLKMERDLAATRDRQEGREAPAKKAAPPAKSQAAKKKPADVIVVPPAGAKANP